VLIISRVAPKFDKARPCYTQLTNKIFQGTMSDYLEVWTLLKKQGSTSTGEWFAARF